MQSPHFVKREAEQEPNENNDEGIDALGGKIESDSVKLIFSLVRACAGLCVELRGESVVLLRVLLCLTFDNF